LAIVNQTTIQIGHTILKGAQAATTHKLEEAIIHKVEADTTHKVEADTIQVVLLIQEEVVIQVTG
jgi:hypothetical protein